jgi:hypothetical protein
VDETLFDLIERETNPELRQVLEHYRAAELELERAAQRLGQMGQNRWQLAAMSRARDLAWQAQRYIKIERAREHKLADFASDADTNPRGYPAWSSVPAAPHDPTPMGFAVPAPEEVPNVEALRLQARRERMLFACVNAAIFVFVVGTLWLLVHALRVSN